MLNPFCFPLGLLGFHRELEPAGGDPLAESNPHSIRWSMSTKDQLLYSALHGTAMRYAAERRNLNEAIEELRQIAAAVTTSWPRLQASPRALGMPAQPLTLGMS
jgi:hypothetical protein